MKKEWSSGKITAVIFGVIAALAVLIIAWCISIIQLTNKLQYINARIEEKRKDSAYSSYPYDEEESGYDPDEDADEDIDEEHIGLGEYYEIEDAIREDLFYQVSFTGENRFYGETENVELDIFYPVIKGTEEEDFSGLNSAINREIANMQAYAEKISGQINEQQEYYYGATSYVTYMDEEVCSILFWETGYLDGRMDLAFLRCINIDMESRMVMTNTHLLNMDDAFSIEFRERCEKQNGTIDALDYYSDQEITELLNDDEGLIIFYTPMGMEVGVNYEFGWATVTYPDYQKYQKGF